MKKHIEEYDYDGLLASDAPKDEFDSFSHELAGNISENDTVEQIANLIANFLIAG